MSAAAQRARSAAVTNPAALVDIEATLRDALARHWPEYLTEGAELGAFVVSACVFGTLLGHPASPLVAWLPDPFVRRVAMGLAMGLTAVAIVSSPFGQQAGGHLNPAFTLTFYRLGKIAPWDATFSVGAQFAGGLAGVVSSAWVVGSPVAHPAVNYVVTTPGPAGEGAAFAAEVAISFVMMTVVLVLGNHPTWAWHTPRLVGVLVALSVVFEAPLCMFKERMRGREQSDRPTMRTRHGQQPA